MASFSGDFNGDAAASEKFIAGNWRGFCRGIAVLADWSSFFARRCAVFPLHPHRTACGGETRHSDGPRSPLFARKPTGNRPVQ